MKPIIALRNSFLKHPIASLSVLHILTLTIIIIIAKTIFHIPDYFFLKGDSFGGAYEIGRRYFEGKSSLLHQWIPPGIPLSLYLINYFPESLHAYLRILISEILIILSMYLGFKIFYNYLELKAIIWGLIVSLFNPLFLWWTCVKAGPDIYVAVFLGIIIYSSLKLFKDGFSFHFYILLISIPVSIFFKPVLFMVPFFLILFVLLRKNYKMALLFTLIFALSIFSLKIAMDTSKPPTGATYELSTFMIDPIFTEVMFNTGKLGYYNDGDSQEYTDKDSYLYKFNKTMNEYFSGNDSNDRIEIIMHYVKENLSYFLLSKLLNPFYFISVSNTTKKTILLFLLNFVILFVSILNMKRMKKLYPEQISILIFILFGYYFTFFLTHSCARYAIPLLFYISIFSGVSINNWIGKISFKKGITSSL